MQFLAIVAFVGARYRLADRHSSPTSDGSPSLNSRSPATAVQSMLRLYLCVQLKVWTIIHTRSYPENRINGRPQIYYACTWWLTIQITKHTQCHCHKRKQPLRGTVCMDVSGIHILPYSAIVATTLEMGCASTLQETIQWNQYLMLTKLKLSIHELLGDLQNTSPGETSQMLVTCFLHCITLQTGCSQPTAYILLL